MRRMAVILGLLWGLATLAPWWAGRGLEAEYEARLAEVPSSPFLDVRAERYERGWFSSQAVTVIEPVAGAAAPELLTAARQAPVRRGNGRPHRLFHRRGLRQIDRGSPAA